MLHYFFPSKRLLFLQLLYYRVFVVLSINPQSMYHSLFANYLGEWSPEQPPPSSGRQTASTTPATTATADTAISLRASHEPSTSEATKQTRQWRCCFLVADLLACWPGYDVEICHMAGCREKHHNTGFGSKQSTMNHRYAVLSSFYAFCIKQEWLDYNPIDHLSDRRSNRMRIESARL